MSRTSRASSSSGERSLCDAEPATHAAAPGFRPSPPSLDTPRVRLQASSIGGGRLPAGFWSFPRAPHAASASRAGRGTGTRRPCAFSSASQFSHHLISELVQQLGPARRSIGESQQASDSACSRAVASGIAGAGPCCRHVRFPGCMHQPHAPRHN